MSTSTVRLHRVLRAAPEKVYRAFIDPEAMAKWLPPNGFTGKVHHIDAKVGGTYKMSFYVADASILPTALGSNPLLTITALAERIADLIVTDPSHAPLFQPALTRHAPPTQSM